MEQKNKVNIDDVIKEYENKIVDLNAKYNTTKELLSSFSESEQLERFNLKQVLDSIKKRLESLEKKLTSVKVLKECSYNAYVINYEITVEEKVSKYRNELNKHLELLVSNGFDDEKELSDFNELYNEIERIIDTLVKTIDIIVSVEEKDNDYEMLYSALNQAYYSYVNIQNDYCKFLKVLKYDETTSKISGETIKYIIDNTSLIHLVFTNNTYPKIGAPKNLNRMFRCQFHNSVESTLDMRVRMHKNYFQCFGCGLDGNQIDYLMQYEGITYDQAIYLLAEIYLIDIPNNPYKNEENSKLVAKYRNMLVSDEYMQFLIDSYNAVKTKDINVDFVYANLFMQVERARKGIVDPNFVYKEKTKKFKLDSPVDLKKVCLEWNLKD